MGFPLFERDPETGAIASTHHPFTAPGPGQEALLESDPLAMVAQHYDLVLNGFELGSGSIRIHDAAFQKKIFELFGIGDAEIEDRFGFFMEALRYGAPAARRHGVGHRPPRHARLRRDVDPRGHRVFRRTRPAATS